MLIDLAMMKQIYFVQEHPGVLIAIERPRTDQKLSIVAVSRSVKKKLIVLFRDQA